MVDCSENNTNFQANFNDKLFVHFKTLEFFHRQKFLNSFCQYFLSWCSKIVQNFIQSLKFC